MDEIEHGKTEDIPDELPDELKSLIQDCWKRDPDERPTIDDVIRRLDEYMGNNSEFSYEQGLALLKEKNYTDARPHIEWAAERNHAPALATLGSMVAKGQGGLTADPQAAYDYFRRAGEAGSIRGKMNQAIMLEKGTGGIAQNVITARQLYSEIVEADDPNFSPVATARIQKIVERHGIYGVGAKP